MSELTPRERALQIAKWMYHMQNTTSNIDQDSIIPVTVRLSYKHIQIVMAGVCYIQGEHETYYLIGAGPYERVLSMTGQSDSANICFKFGSIAFYVAGYLPSHEYDMMNQDLKDKMYPFGANLTLRESDDAWLCEGKIVVDMKPDFDLTVVLD